MSSKDRSVMTLADSVLHANVAFLGGALHTDGASVAVVHGCTIDSNAAESSGGALMARGLSSVTVTESTMSNNAASVSH